MAASTASASIRRRPPQTSLPSLARYSGSRPRISQAPLHFLAQRQRVFADADADLRRSRELVQHGRDPAARRVAHAVNAGQPPQQRRRSSPSSGGAVAFDVGSQRMLAARDQDRRAMVAQQAVDDHHVAGLRARRRDRRPCGTTPTPAVLMNSLSQAPRSTTLVSPVTMTTPASSATCAHACRHAAQDIDGEALLDHHAARQKQRPRAADGEVVDRARRPPACRCRRREKQRIDDVAIGSERQPVAVGARGPRGGNTRLVFQRG